jgi:hypothetical protein
VTLEILTLIGVFTIPLVLRVLMDHVKQASRWRPGTKRGSVWPLATDIAAVAWVAMLHRASLLQYDIVVPDGVPIRWEAIVLLGITFGVLCTLGYDGLEALLKRRQPPAQP